MTVVQIIPKEYKWTFGDVAKLVLKTHAYKTGVKKKTVKHICAVMK